MGLQAAVLGRQTRSFWAALCTLRGRGCHSQTDTDPPVLPAGAVVSNTDTYQNDPSQDSTVSMG